VRWLPIHAADKHLANLQRAIAFVSKMRAALMIALAAKPNLTTPRC